MNVLIVKGRWFVVDPTGQVKDQRNQRVSREVERAVLRLVEPPNVAQPEPWWWR